MTSKEVEQLAELVAIKTNEKMKECVLEITEKMINDHIVLHSAQCEVGRLTTIKTIVLASIVSAMTLFGNWIVRKL